MESPQRSVTFSRLALALAGTVVLAAVLALAWVLRPPAPKLMEAGAVPAFHLTDQDGKSLGLEDLKGKVWVASFIYTRCRTSCPVVTADMARLARALRGQKDLRLVSVSVDPTHDTPAVLKAYAKDMGAVDPRWSFLTGKPRAVYDLVQGGFHLSAGGPQMLKNKGAVPLMHSTKLALVDRRGHIRGYFDTGYGTKGGVRDAERAARWLLRNTE